MIKDGSQVYVDNVFHVPNGSNRVGDRDDFPGNVNDLMREARCRLSKQVKSGKCNKAGGRVEEFNWRYCAMHNRQPVQK